MSRGGRYGGCHLLYKLGEVRNTFRLRRKFAFMFSAKRLKRIVQLPVFLLKVFYRLGYYLVRIQGLDVR